MTISYCRRWHPSVSAADCPADPDQFCLCFLSPALHLCVHNITIKSAFISINQLLFQTENVHSRKHTHTLHSNTDNIFNYSITTTCELHTERKLILIQESVKAGKLQIQKNSCNAYSLS